MADDDKEFSHESLQDRESILQCLTALGEGFEQGRLRLSSGDEELILETPSMLRLAVRAKQKRNRVEVSVRISWKDHSRRQDLTVEPLSNGRE